MNWQEAKDETLKRWIGIRDETASAAPSLLMTKINALADLCRLAQDEAGGDWRGRCEFCRFHQHFGGCLEAKGRMSQLLTEGDRKGLGELVDEFIEELMWFKVPDEDEEAAERRAS